MGQKMYSSERNSTGAPVASTLQIGGTKNCEIQHKLDLLHGVLIWWARRILRPSTGLAWRGAWFLAGRSRGAWFLTLTCSDRKKLQKRTNQTCLKIIFVFYRSKKIVFKKKLELFEHRANDIILASVFPNDKSTAIVNQGCSTIGFPIENRSVN